MHHWVPTQEQAIREGVHEENTICQYLTLEINWSQLWVDKDGLFAEWHWELFLSDDEISWHLTFSRSKCLCDFVTSFEKPEKHLNCLFFQRYVCLVSVV